MIDIELFIVWVRWRLCTTMP